MTAEGVIGATLFLQFILGLIVILAIIIAIKFMFRNSYRKDTAETDLDIKYLAFEESALDKVAKKCGVNLNKYLLMKESDLDKKFKRKLQEEMITEMFGSEVKKEE